VLQQRRQLGHRRQLQQQLAMAKQSVLLVLQVHGALAR